MRSTVIFEQLTLTLVLIFSRAFMHELSEDRCRSARDACEAPPVGVVSSSAWALVPYDEKTLTVADFYRDERRLQFAEFTVTINQNWRDIGVAAVVWEAAVVLAEYLEKHRELVENKTVLELGAGTGLAGIFAAMLGAYVTVTDRPVALPVLQKNIERNDAENVQVLELTWGQKNLDQFSRPYEVVIGADIVYIEETFEDLLLTIDQLSDNKTTVILSCQIRYERDLRFIQLLRKCFAVQLLHQNRDVTVFTARKL